MLGENRAKNKHLIATGDIFTGKRKTADKPLIRGIFNFIVVTLLGTAILYADRIFLKSKFPDATISTSNFPLPPNSTQSLRKNSNFQMQGGIISFNLIIGVMIMFSAFGVLPVRERKNGVDTLQYCSGAPIWLMWLAEYVWDFINALPSIG